MGSEVKNLANSAKNTIIGGGLLGSMGGSAGAVKDVSRLMNPQFPDMSIPAPPTLPAPITMPTPNDAQVKAAKRKSLAEQMMRGGRASTILSPQSDKLGA